MVKDKLKSGQAMKLVMVGTAPIETDIILEKAEKIGLYAVSGEKSG